MYLVDQTYEEKPAGLFDSPLFVCLNERYFIFIFTSWTYKADIAHQIQLFIPITKIKHVDKTLV